MSKVNLDALVPREDFEIADSYNQNVGRSKDTLSINDLKRTEFFFSALRKPDFQRETSEWDSNKISDFIKSFLDGDLIPAIILWRTVGSYIFVIDGSHRISALAAWVNDDYGDGEISKYFYDGIIPSEQLETADRTRQSIKKNIGSFRDYQFAVENSDKVPPEILSRAKSMGALAIQLQWVQGDASKAEASFFKINQQASPIDPTELRVLKARKKPNGIAARAILRSGKGHKYWSAFDDETQASIQETAKDINNLLFTPKLDSPIKTLDLPIAGKLQASQSLALVLDFINIVNSITDDNSLKSDPDGSNTIRFLNNCRKVAQQINSNHPGSLGLHPIVYFYSGLGRHKIGSFYAVTALVIDLDKRNLFRKFTRIRANFENILLKYDYLVQQIVRKYRTSLAGYPHVKDFYLACINKLDEGKPIEQVITEISQDNNFAYLTQYVADLSTQSQDFSRETKSAAFISQALSGALRCNICGGYLHKNSISIDHITRKQDGGLGTLDNAQLAHPYCNSAIKN
jgi:hypothetical protein